MAKVKLKYDNEIVKALAEKYNMSEKTAKETVKYINKRLVQIMKEPETMIVSFGCLGDAYVSLPVLKLYATKFSNEKENRNKKLRILLDSLEVNDVRSKRKKIQMVNLPRFLNKDFTGRRTLKQLEQYQNGEE